MLLVSPYIPPSIVPYLELRERYERRVNPAFSSKPDANRADLYQRIRAGADLRLNKTFSGVLEYQYLNDLYWTHLLNANSHNSDLSLGYLRIDGPDLWTQLGRQRIEIGDERLFGISAWQTLGRSWDAARFDSGPFDIWFGRLGVANTKTETARAGGISITSPTAGITSLFFKHDTGASGNIDIVTADYQIDKHLGSLELKGDGAFQTGEDSGKNQQAFAYHLNATENITKKLSATAEYDVASGGNSNHVNRSFDNLYPSSHDLFELADIVTWKNIDHIRFLVDGKVSRTYAARLEYSINSLRDPSDAWYATSGSANIDAAGKKFLDPTGKSGRMIGDELDLIGYVNYSKKASLSAGVGLFHPGDFVRNINGSGRQYMFAYIMLDLKTR